MYDTGRAGIILLIHHMRKNKTRKEVSHRISLWQTGTILSFELSDFYLLFFPLNKAVLFFIIILLFLH